MAPRYRYEKFPDFPEMVYIDLESMDADVAAAYKKAQNGNPKAKVGRAGAKLIFDAAMRDRKISPGESEALTLILGHGMLNWEAWAYLKEEASKDSFVVALNEGAGVRLVRRDQLYDVEDALGIGWIGKVYFWSPGTAISYSPIYYEVIRRLIDEDKIEVYQVESGGLGAIHSARGRYSSGRNRLYVYRGLEFYEKIRTIVHEATHAIQDWRDVSAKLKYQEADAFIAGATADQNPGGSSSSDNVYKTAYEKARPLVLNGTARSMSTQWVEAYEAVVQAVSASSAYSATKDQISKEVQPGEGDSEKRYFDGKIKSAEQFLKWMADLARSQWGRVPVAIRDTLP